MKYATWKLNFDNPEYGTGPEDSIVSQGFTAEGAWVSGSAHSGGTILGYFTGTPTQLLAWNFTEVSEAEALEFCLAINPNAMMAEDGRFFVPTDPGGVA